MTSAQGFGSTSRKPWIGGAGVAGSGVGTVGTTVASCGEGGAVDGAAVGEGAAAATAGGDMGRGVVAPVGDSPPVGDGMPAVGEARDVVGALSGTRVGGVATVLSGTRV